MGRRKALKPTRRAGASPAPRLHWLDALRGLALLAMIAYHFCYDLNLFGYIRTDFERVPFWLVARSTIVTSFLLIAGIGLVLARQRPDFARHFWRRVLRVAGCALLVTAATAVLFPASFIWFGILHAIAAASVLARPMIERPWLALSLGIAVIALGLLFAAPLFDHPALRWIGLTTRKPFTEDYVPLLPWMGVMLIGIWAGHALLHRAPRVHAHGPGWLRLLGRNSLLVYMVHQPVLVGALWVANHVSR